MVQMRNWVGVLFYLSFIFSIIGVYRFLSPEQKRQYQPWFIAYPFPCV